MMNWDWDWWCFGCGGFLASGLALAFGFWVCELSGRLVYRHGWMGFASSFSQYGITAFVVHLALHILMSWLAVFLKRILCF